MALTANMLRPIGIVVVIIIYAVLANYTNQSAYIGQFTHIGTLGVLVALAPIALAAVLLVLNSRQRVLMFGLSIFAGILLWLAWPLLKQHYGWIYWLEHESLQFILFMTFTRTLFANRKPLCTQLAEIIHGTLTPAQISYAYKVTVAWALFFAMMIITSTSLFFIYPIGVWSVFSNFVFLPLVVLMFIVEFIIRKRILPNIAHASIIDTVRIFRNNSRRRD
jgi:uncharacterized membrane protein